MNRLRWIPVGGVMGLCAMIACSEDGDVLIAYGPPTLTFEPACGSPGDKVRLTMDMKDPLRVDAEYCNTPERYAVKFAPNASGPVVVAQRGTEETLCHVETTVPADARTGTIQLELSNEPDIAQRDKYESQAVFTIPCPADPGQDAGDAGEGGDESIAAVYDMRRSGAGTTFRASLFRSTTPAEQAAVEAHAKLELERLTAPGVALGTCGDPTTTTVPADSLPTVGAGAVSVSNAGAPLASVQPQTSNNLTFYEAPVPNAPIGADLDVTIEGSDAFPAVTVPGALRSAPELVVTSPDLASGQVLVPEGDLTITVTPTDATHMTILVQPIAGGTPKVCKVDPKAGSFTIPAAVLGASGTSTSLGVRMGNIKETVAGGRRHVSIADVNLTGLVSVQ